MMRPLLPYCVALLLILHVMPVAPIAQAATTCTYLLGFATLHDMIPTIVGNCVDNEQHNPTNGDALQHTVTGLLVWRKADNWTAFTDGYRTWINGPAGIAQRLNTQRFAWEANPTNLPVVTASSPGSPPGIEPAAVPTAVAAKATAVPTPTSVSGGAHDAGHTFYASTHKTGSGHFDAHLIYCDDDPRWQRLSPDYLASFPSLAAAEAALPGFTLARPC